MSNIYIQEPPTWGKVLLITTVGELDIELWAREAPKACRNFIQLCMEGYYNGTKFHRVVKGFMVQGGDPTGTGHGGESIYGQPFKDEFHTRLRFCRRGLVAMANAGKDDNGSQFFFTFAPTPELQNKHTIFGKIAGETIYNMLKLEEADTDANEAPLYPQKIIRTEILNNPFPDIVPRCLPPKKEKKKEKKEKKSAGVKNFKLLSFGEEAEEDEEESKEISLTFAGRGKSTHDMLDDPKLSSVPAVEARESSLSGDENDDRHSVEESVGEKLDLIKKKLKRPRSRSKERNEPAKNDEEDEYYLGKDIEDKKKARLQEIRSQISDLKKEYKKNQKESRRSVEKDEEKDKHASKSGSSSSEKDNNLIVDYRSNLEKYGSLKGQIPKKGAARESYTLSLLAKFQKKLRDAKDKAPAEEEEKEEKEEKKEVEEEGDESWLTHKLNFESNAPVLAKDANTKSDDWFDITDPRNPINKRRREAGKGQHKRSK